MELYPLLGIEKGVTAIIGSGGKSTLLHTLAMELPGRVLLCTSTHFRAYDDLPLAVNPTAEGLRRLFVSHKAICAGKKNEQGKLRDCGLPYELLASVADYVLVEADGSRQLPLKAHAAHEPVVPPCSRQVICVVGMSGLHRPVREAVHRPELFCPLAGCNPEDEVTAELVARGLLREGLADTIFLNQAESDSILQDAAVIASRLKLEGLRVVCGSQRQQQYKVL